MSLIFRLAGVDTAELGDLTRPYIHAELRRKAEEALAAGEIPVFGGPWTFWGSTIRPGEVMVNMVRLWGDATDSAVLTRNELEAREHIRRFVGFLRSVQPEFKDCRLIDSAAQIGVRETRRIVGDYRLEDADILAGRRFPDSIALGGHVIDIHSPAGTAGQIRRKVAPYQIPYRCLLPRGLANLLVAGRPISASHAAHASLRVMGTAMATGQAAGAAAALAARAGLDTRALALEELRGSLAGLGGLYERGVRD